MSIIEKLREISWNNLNIDYVILFGSAVQKHQFEDLDLAVKFTHDPDLDLIGKLLEQIEIKLGIPCTKIDLVVLNRDDLPCELILEIFRKGMLIHCQDFQRYVDDALRRVMLCWDFEIVVKKLDLVNVALQAVKRRWRS